MQNDGAVTIGGQFRSSDLSVDHRIKPCDDEAGNNEFDHAPFRMSGKARR